MGTIDFMAAKANRDAAAELEEAKRKMVEMLLQATEAERLEIYRCIETHDAEAYSRVIRPIVIRQAMREMNPKRGCDL